MNVLLVSLQKRGGGAIDGLEFSNGLAKNRFAHQAVISAGNEYADQWNEHADIRRVVKVPTYGGSMASVLLWTASIVRPWRFLRVLAGARAGIVHIIDFHPWAFFVYAARPFLKYRIFYAPQDNPFDPKEEPNVLMAPIERYFVRHADLVIAYSEFMRRDIGQYVHKPIEVLPLGIYTHLGEKIVHKPFSATGPLRALFFGRIEPYKGLDLLVEAAEIAHHDGCDVALTVAGRGAITDALRARMDAANITLVNRWVSDEELESLVAEADVLIAPYRKATQSGIVSVGLACRVPLIGTDVGALPEYIRDGVNGFIVPPDAAALAQKIKVLCDDRSLLATFSQGAEAIRERYSWERIAEKAVTVYAEDRFR